MSGSGIYDVYEHMGIPSEVVLFSESDKATYSTSYTIAEGSAKMSSVPSCVLHFAAERWNARAGHAAAAAAAAGGCEAAGALAGPLREGGPAAFW